jgi:hypothetical protein
MANVAIFPAGTGLKRKPHAIPARKCFSRVGIGQPTYKPAQPGAQQIFNYQNHTTQILIVNTVLAIRDNCPLMHGTYAPVPNVIQSQYCANNRWHREQFDHK